MRESNAACDSDQVQLREFIERVIRNEEQDNRRLAFDLHDGLVQLMVASYQHLQAAQAWQQRDPALEQKELNQGLTILRQAISEARRLINELRPSGLDELGLVQAVKLYTAQTAADTGWDICLDISPEWHKLPADMETALFRIIQEAITNARKYSRTSRLAISLESLADKLVVTIRDWGCGFLPDKVVADQSGMHIGLIGIRERARLWGGICTIDSQPGKGTEIRIEFPNQYMSADTQ
ncbi:MAG: sensor histidine kinase [Chloroflexi bacterium]|nr:sensor histidine kinase [Chloroflexota bacterium]